MEYLDRTPVTHVTVDYHRVTHNGNVAFQNNSKT